MTSGGAAQSLIGSRTSIPDVSRPSRPREQSVGTDRALARVPAAAPHPDPLPVKDGERGKCRGFSSHRNPTFAHHNSPPLPSRTPPPHLPKSVDFRHLPHHKAASRAVAWLPRSNSLSEALVGRFPVLPREVRQPERAGRRRRARTTRRRLPCTPSSRRAVSNTASLPMTN